MKRLTLLAVLLSVFCIAAAKKTPPLIVRFYVEAAPSDGEKFVKPIQLMNPPREATINSIAMVNEDDIIAFHPFQAANGTWGAYFKLGHHGTKVVEAFTLRHRGRVVVAMVDGRQVVNMVVDKPIQDGIVVIPSGLAASEIERMRAQWRLIGKETDAKKKQADKMKKIISGEFDTTEDPELGPTQAKPTPIPVSTPPPAGSPSPVKAATPKR